MKKIFISHSSEDKEIVGELIALIEGIKSVTLTSTMGPGVKLNVAKLMN